MENLANSFSVLELDAGDSHVPTTAGNSDKGVNPDIGVIPVKNKKQDQENAVFPSCEYKLPLVWIDLEMTGLNIEVDRILEIACIITDGYLTKTVEVLNSM
ncbi:oligoribonuclease [Vigna unguiculata]|uniref:Oligoribonuclease n=1 Tax=Vigna unguiculata TaxID=3917 RepID=A0A4D6ML74_VIGUN|nr:oligoribonuclease [Vigna unguiculata]